MKTSKEYREQLEEAKGSFRAGYQKAKKRFEQINSQIGEENNSEIELDESGNPIKRLNTLDFDTRGKAAVANIKGDKKKEKLYSKQLNTLKKFRDKLALESIHESLITGTRKIATFEGDHGHKAEVRYNSEYKEYQVHHYKDGQHLGDKSISFHDDKHDAISTAKYETGVNESNDLEEKYEGFSKLKAKLSHQKGITDPAALAASIGRKKYGKEKFQKMAADGKKD